MSSATELFRLIIMTITYYKLFLLLLLNIIIIIIIIIKNKMTNTMINW